MKIASVCYRDAYSRDGVVKKIETQIEHWRSAGHDPIVFCISRPANGRSPAFEAEVFPFASLTTRIMATRRLVERVKRFNPDFVYLRYDFYLPPPRGLLRRYRNAVEINTNDRGEWGIRSPRARFYLVPNQRAILGNAAGFVCVTHELAASPTIAAFNRPTVVISNGYDIEATRLLPPTTNRRPRAVFIGHTDLPWHGVDKILWLARALPDVEFGLIGFVESELDNVPPNVVCHGFMERHAYEPILAASDVAFGTLALHRKGMSEACPLKVREYLLYGLPTIIGYQDTDFLGEHPPYLLELPNREDNVSARVDEIRSFIDRARGYRVPREDVEYRFSAAERERDRLAFFTSLTAA